MNCPLGRWAFPAGLILRAAGSSNQPYPTKDTKVQQSILYER
jgi:hypothetical protein